MYTGLPAHHESSHLVSLTQAKLLTRFLELNVCGQKWQQTVMELLQALPDRAASHIAAEAYMSIRSAIKDGRLDQHKLAQFEYGAADVVCLAVARFIDYDNREARKSGLQDAFGGQLPQTLYSKLGNSFHQLFERDFAENPARARGYAPTDEAGRTRRGPRKSQKRTRSRGKRNKSEPPSESRCMTGIGIFQ